MAVDAPDPRPGSSKYAHLPEPIRLEDTVTSADVQPVHEEKDDYWREVEWMLRVTGAGG